MSQKAITEFFGRFWKLIALVVFLIGAFLKAGALVDIIRKSVVKSVLKDAQGTLWLSAMWGWVLTLGASLFVVFCFLAIYYAWKSHTLGEQVQRQAKTEAGVLEKTLDGMMGASTLILNQLYPPAKKLPIAYDQISYAYVVDADGSTATKRRYDIRAFQGTLHFWDVRIGVEDEATPIKYLDEINFKIEDLSGKERVAYLPAENMPHRKKMVVFFLPEVTPDEPEARQIEATYSWPGMLNRLLQKGKENFVWTVDSRRRVPKIDFTLYFHPSIGRIGCDIVGKRPGNDVLEEVTSDQSWAGWRYRITDAPPEFRYELSFKKKRT